MAKRTAKRTLFPSPSSDVYSTDDEKTVPYYVFPVKSDDTASEEDSILTQEFNSHLLSESLVLSDLPSENLSHRKMKDG